MVLLTSAIQAKANLKDYQYGATCLGPEIIPWYLAQINNTWKDFRKDYRLFNLFLYLGRLDLWLTVKNTFNHCVDGARERGWRAREPKAQESFGTIFLKDHFYRKFLNRFRYWKSNHKQLVQSVCSLCSRSHLHIIVQLLGHPKSSQC